MTTRSNKRHPSPTIYNTKNATLLSIVIFLVILLFSSTTAEVESRQSSDSFAFPPVELRRRGERDQKITSGPIRTKRNPLQSIFPQIRRRSSSEEDTAPISSPNSVVDLTYNLWRNGPLNRMQEYYSNFLTKKLRDAVEGKNDHLLEKDKPYALFERRKMETAAQWNDDEQIAIENISRRANQFNENTPVHKRFAPVPLFQIKDDHAPLKRRAPTGMISPRSRITLTGKPFEDEIEDEYVRTATINPCFQSNKTDIVYSRWIEYTEQVFQCNGTTLSPEEYRITKATPEGSLCTANLTTIRGCFCPQDRFGLRCEQQASITCQVFRQSPRNDCVMPKGFTEETMVQGGVPLSSAGMNCLRYRRTDTAAFRFNMECRSAVSEVEAVDANRFPKTVIFRDLETGRNMSWTQLMSSFNYFVAREPVGSGVYKLAITEPVSYPMQFAPVNFYDFSDHRATRELQLDLPGYYTGEVPFFFRLPFEEVPGEFYAGNRLYIEVGFPTVRPILFPILVPIYVDFPGTQDPKYRNTNELLAYILIPTILTLILVLLIACCGFQLFRRYRNRKILKTD